MGSVPVGGLGFKWSITEFVQFPASLWRILVSVVTGAPQQVHPCPQADVVDVGAAVRTFRAAAGKVAGLVGLDGAVGPVVQV